MFLANSSWTQVTNGVTENLSVSSITIDPNNPQNFGADCFHCHGNSLFMRREFLTNGLSDNGDKGLGDVTGNPNDNYKFKTTSLRNFEDY